MEVFQMPVRRVLLTLVLLFPMALMALTPTGAEEKIRQLLEKSVKRNKHVHLGLLLVHSDKLDIHWKYAAGEVEDMNSRYHIASIGKIFTATLISQLVEQGILQFDTPIATILPDTILDDLFVYEGTDYRNAVHVRHLLNHTSGVADWFEDKPKDGPSFLQQALDHPQRVRTPDDALLFTRKQLQAIAQPGGKFHYSDTGYHLLGKIIEIVTGDSLHQVLHQQIFEPLEMRQSQMLFYSEPADSAATDMLHAWLGDVEVSSHKWLKADWAGGGVVTNTEDLLKYMRALVNYELVSKQTLTAWQDIARFSYGIDYGYGIVLLNFHKFSPFYSKDLNVWGNWGSIATFMFYNPKHDIYIIGAFNQSRYIRKIVSFLMRVMRIVDRAVV
ncbi:MAG: serine hydrolase [Calditrichaeota bacterium]|nr:serine hydrolase [Calditrichota bacterium]MQY72073.1 serine hydrolase [Dehalococcoidia bacterium]